MVITARTISAVPEEESGDQVACPCVLDLLEAYQEKGRPRFAELRAAYEAHQGKIVEEYYATHFQAALLVVAKQQTGEVDRVVYKLRQYYDAVQSTADFDDVFRSARRVERKYSVLLGGRPQEILVQGIYTETVALLSVLDAMVGSEQKRERLTAAVASARKEIRQIEQNARDAALDRALVRYLGGLAVGAVVAAAVAAAVHFLLKVEIGSQLVVCVVAGAIGAIVSVMTRTANRQRVRVSLDQGLLVVILSGCFRLIIGAVFGAAMFVLVRAGLLPLAVPVPGEQVTLFFAGLAFLAGFSERRAQDTIVRTLPGAVEQNVTEPARGKES
ncbi:hypothetical protein SAMN05421837_11618 [Amycolatopsis pretoriensis]|uniref:Uncharacterized protein n=1 Tax=Amycolatopsis pretoriensis TaxID=218821 RepID=A0A1H5RHL6_9PSEU|nr:hypothetical protein [Amycolatopsis pretoriensis]SEF37842.1 hypothetical protein SAMN05421837_11618 [Amycolatopsis pretoriensis]